MKKKLLVATVMAAMTLSATSVFAAPITFSGDGYVEYNDKEVGPAPVNGFDARFRLDMDTTIDNYLHAHARLVHDADLSTSWVKDYEGAQATRFDKAYIGGKLGNVDLQVGKDDLFTGKGLIIDDHQFSGVKASTNIDKLTLSGFYGKDRNQIKTGTIDMKASVGRSNLGANYVTLGNDHFYGINADTKLDDANLNVEYVKNSDTDAKGYIAGVTMGNYTVSYRDIEAGAVTDYSTNSNYNDSKGFKVSAHYGLSNNTSVTMYQDFAKDQAGASKHRTNVEFDYNF